MSEIDLATDDSRWAVHVEMVPERLSLARRVEAEPQDMPPVEAARSSLEPSSARRMAGVRKAVDYGFYFGYSLLALGLVLALTDWAPMTSALVLPFLLAIGGCALGHSAINGALRLLSLRQSGS